MSSKTRTCISNSIEERRSFQSIKYQFTPDPISFLRITYLRGKYILLILVVLNQDLSNKNEKFQRLRSKKSEEVIPHTVVTVYIYRYMQCIHIYCYLEQSCREESLSMLVQHGKPPSLSGFSSQYRMLGGPRLLGLSELGSRQLQKQAIVIFACVLQDCKS